jgi:S1-C subfamily serine protease
MDRTDAEGSPLHDGESTDADPVHPPSTPPGPAAGGPPPAAPPAVPLGPVGGAPPPRGDGPERPEHDGSEANGSFLPPQWRESDAGTGQKQAAGPTDDRSVAVTAPGASVVPVWAPVNRSADPPAPPAATKTVPGWRWAAVSLVAALVGALIGGGIVAAADHGGGSTTVKEISAGPALLNGTTDIETVIDKVLPAIVSIDAKSPAAPSVVGGGSGGVQEDQGTGMIITSDGEVVTNNHVIAGATTITVTLYGKLASMPATLIDTDPTNDVALLKITGVSDLPTVSYGNSKDVQVGDAVVAIGNALGLQAGSPTVTQGIISATGRTVQASDSSGSDTETLSNMFQTDAAINPGNSGGPLVDSSGRVIGMNTAVASSVDGTSEAQNIGFAIPSDKIQQLLPALRSRSIHSNSQSRTGYLGVDIETLTSELRSAYNFVPTQGAVVLQVLSASPAASAGLRQGDVITSFDGKAITSADQLATAIQAKSPGQKVSIGLYRGQSRLTVTATLGSNSNQ